ncbi:beta-propeller domain-containing protein [Candidatus Woesearchaeota archaeon]|nr:beta-propeller domain-containing protein [Candidatus Woesearchaeota archaeon]
MTNQLPSIARKQRVSAGRQPLLPPMIALSVILLFIASCKIIPEPGTYKDSQFFDPAKELKPLTFSSKDQFNAFFKQYQQGRDYGGFGGIFRTAAMAETAVMDKSSAPASTPSAPTPQDSSQQRGFSPTNNQIEAVDEADIIKTDGNYIYTITGKTLFIIKAYPGEGAEVTARIQLDNYPQSLFIKGDYLAVFGNTDHPQILKRVGLSRTRGMSFLTIYDLSDKEKPKVAKEFKFEGNYFQARMIEDYIYLITVAWPDLRVPYPTPIILEGTTLKSIPVEDIVYFPIPYDSPQLANIHAIDITQPEKDITSKSLVVEGANNLYMSENNIYLTYTKYINEWQVSQKITREVVEPKLSPEDKAFIERIKTADDDILSPAEKEQKIIQVIQDYINSLEEDGQETLQDTIAKKVKETLQQYEYMEFTVIHKIEVKNGDIDVKASGSVPGHITSQFSLDENEGILRIATTANERWPSLEEDGNPVPVSFDEDSSDKRSMPISIMPPRRFTSSNNIFTLDRNLDIIDSLKGLAEGEQIYSTRFIGDRLYMVTFRQVDPFFVFDLSNPNNIQELGKLKIPGFSRYLHPYDKDTVIGIGRDATEEGRQKGIKISLFDVSDVAKPKEIAKWAAKEKYSQTSAEWEHKAFLFSKEKELLVIPGYNYDYSHEGESYNGALVFSITKESIELRGIIDHSEAKQQWYSPQVERSLFIEELLYTKSPALLRINSIEDLKKVKNIELESKGEKSIPVY